MIQITGRAVGQFHERYDAWLVTTLGAPPIALGTIDIEERDVVTAFGPIIDYVPFTPLQNATGQPAISLPLHWTADGLPVGLMFSRQARRRGDAPPPRRPARAGAAVEGPAAADLGLRQVVSC